MKTRHLLFATALVASLAACTNDDFTIDKQQPVADGRPTVSDVKLNFTESGADTRLAFGKNGYAWEANDTIGALLMDNVKEDGLVGDKTWFEKYELTKYIHTSYPFTYSTADKTWSCNTKMLEGNYFFAFPWESYDGQRQVRHSLTKQEQKGVKGNVVAESYAKNQFFIGYAQIKAGTNAKDALTDVEMTSLLGAVQLRIVNTGTQTYHINKIVLRGNKIKSELTFNPTDAAYGTTDTPNAWNLKSEWGYATNEFNYANYTGNEKDLYETGGDYVYNIEAGHKYDKKEALRKVVEAAGTAANAQLIITGTPEERALVSTKDDPKAVAYALIMANAQELVDEQGSVSGELLLDIYTDEGLVSSIDLTKINVASGNEYKAITDSKVAEISPEVANTIKVQIDDNSFAIPDKMKVYDGEDLLQFIKWNAAVTGVRTATATLHKDVTLTKEMTDELAKNKNLSLTITSTDTDEEDKDLETKLTIAKDVAENVLESEKLAVDADIEVLGTLALSNKTNKFQKEITVAETGTVNINTDDVNSYSITNNGTLNIGEGVTYKNGSISNFGVMNVAELADVKAVVYNKKDATLNVNGFMSGLTNEIDGIVVMGEGANLDGVNNYGIIRAAKDAIVTTDRNNGEIVYVEGAAISANGTISYETSGKSFGKDAFKDNKVNKLILKAGETKITDDLSIANIVIAEKDAKLTVAKDKTLKVTKLVVEAEGKTGGNIEAENVEVKKEAVLTNNGTIKVTKLFTNNGVVANNGEVNVPAGAAWNLNNSTNWKYNPAKEAPNESGYKAALIVMVRQYVNDSKNYTDLGVGNYRIEPNGFNSSFTTWQSSGSTEQMENAGALKTQMDALGKKVVSQADLDGAVEAIAAEEGYMKKILDAVKAGNWKAQKNLYDTKDAEDLDAETNSAYAEFRRGIAKGVNSDMVQEINANKIELVGAWTLTESEIDALVKEKLPTMFIWEGCDLDKLVKVWKDYDKALGDDFKDEEFGKISTDASEDKTNQAGLLVKWVTKVLNANSTGVPAIERAQKDITDLNIDVVTVKPFAAYTNAQMQEVIKQYR